MPGQTLEELREKYEQLLRNIEQETGQVSLADLIKRAGYQPGETDLAAIETLLKDLGESKEPGDEIFFTLELPGGGGSTVKI